MTEFSHSLTLKHAQTNGRMSIWTRVCRRFGIVGVKF